MVPWVLGRSLDLRLGPKLPLILGAKLGPPTVGSELGAALSCTDGVPLGNWLGSLLV